MSMDIPCPGGARPGKEEGILAYTASPNMTAEGTLEVFNQACSTGGNLWDALSKDAIQHESNRQLQWYRG